MLLLLLIFVFPTTFPQTFPYLSESPVKLSRIDPYGELYPASASEFRNSSDGRDVEVELTEPEENNGLPDQELVLEAGQEAVFVFPFHPDLLFLMVKPGKNIGVRNSPFHDKANITVSAGYFDQKAEVSKECHRPKEDQSPSASKYCTLNLTSLQDLEYPQIKVKIRVPEEETRNAFIWQLHLSPIDDSERMMGTFTEEGRQQLRKTQEQEDTNTWLTMVSIVGKTGVGKSTVASLLSGNDTMFESKASSTGSTTAGVDISPIIPSNQYQIRMEQVLNQGFLYMPNKSRPLFLIDSEGMGYRPADVDFINTGPAAVVANIIAWVIDGRMTPLTILNDIQTYMNGLDRITMGNTTEGQQCYGEFVVVQNMMQGNDSDEKLCEDLMTYSGGNEDAIREEIEKKFKGISCIGLPMLNNVTNGVTYPSLEDYPRFKDGLMKLANQILVDSDTPLDVSVGDRQFEVNSTNAETLLGILVEGANQGNADLSDICNVIVDISRESIIQELARKTEEFDLNTEGLCEDSKICTTCACQYKNKAVEVTKDKLDEEIQRSMEEAANLCEDPKVKDEIHELLAVLVLPWAEANKCIATRSNHWNQTSGSCCDIIEMKPLFENSTGQDINITCDVLHMCDKTIIYNSETKIKTGNIFIGFGAALEQDAPDKAANGTDGQEGSDGEDGEGGVDGKGIHIVVNGSLLTGSYNQFQVKLIGGDGGDGGAGGPGRPGVDGVQGHAGEEGMPGVSGPKGEDGHIFGCNYTDNGDARNCTDVIINPAAIPGPRIKNGKEGEHCCGWGDCTTYRYYQTFTYSYESKSPCDPSLIDGRDGGDGERGYDGGMGGNGTDATPGTKGGNGGNGGNGGKAGSWQLEVPPQLHLNATVTSIGGLGGSGGAAGRGGSRAEGGEGGVGGAGGAGGEGGLGGAPGQCNAQLRVWKAHRNWHEERDECSHFCTSCSRNDVEDPCSHFARGFPGDCLIESFGTPGKPGAPGADGGDGPQGYPGSDAETAEAGNKGEPGQDAPTYVL